MVDFGDCPGGLSLSAIFVVGGVARQDTLLQGWRQKVLGRFVRCTPIRIIAKGQSAPASNSSFNIVGELESRVRTRSYRVGVVEWSA